MARKKKDPTYSEAELKAAKDSEILFRIRENYARYSSADAENRRLFAEDLNFVYNAEDAHAQWDPVVLQARRSRPSYTYNRVIQSVNMVIGDMQQVEPQLKVRAKTKDTAIATAEVFEGMIRDIESASRARQAYNMAFKHAIAGGYGVLRVVPEYADDDSLDQVLRIKAVPNPLTAFWDPECQDPYRADAMWAGVAETISRQKFKAMYPDINPVTFEMGRDQRGWVSSDQIRIAEYFEKVPYYKDIAQLDNGEVMDGDKADDMVDHFTKTGAYDRGIGAKISGRRKVQKWKVVWYKVDGYNILEGPIEYDWKKIPIIRVPGRYIAIEGRQKVQSMIRHSKDSQRTYNLHRSTMIEATALTPRSPYIATPKMIKAYEDMWATANTTNRPYLLYDPDPEAVAAGAEGRPTREPPPDVPQALVALAQQDLADLQAATGYHDASLGSQVNDSDRTSGRALVARQRRGDLGTFEFLENFNGALEVEYDCIMDMIPKIYDTKRIVRVIGQDQLQRYIEVNGDLHDLRKASCDVTCTIGPGYATARQDALETLIEATAAVPAIGQIGADLIAKNIDMRDSDELARRMRIPLIHQGIVKPTPEEMQNMPPPPPPDPTVVAEQQYKQAQAQKMGADAHIAQSKAGTGDIEINRVIADAAGKHLNNMLLAKELAMPPEPTADAAERRVAATAQPGIPAAPGAAMIPNQ